MVGRVLARILCFSPWCQFFVSWYLLWIFQVVYSDVYSIRDVEASSLKLSDMSDDEFMQSADDFLTVMLRPLNRRTDHILVKLLDFEVLLVRGCPGKVQGQISE